MSNVADMLDELTQLRELESPGRLGLMLYGSHARGTNVPESDIDVLELVSSKPESYVVGRANITQYIPQHLETLAQRGSLFVLHLKTEGQIIADPYGRLSSALNAYAIPKNYDPLMQQLAIAAGILDPCGINVDRWVDNLGRLGVYLLRTAVYITRAANGAPDFDLNFHPNDDRLFRAIQMRRNEHFTVADIADLYTELSRLIPQINKNDLITVEAYAVAYSIDSGLAALLGPVLKDSATIDYSTISLPTF